LDFVNKVSNVVINRYLGLVLELISSIIIIRYLGPDDYGQYITTYIMPLLIGSLGSLGFGPSIIYHIGIKSPSVRSYLYIFTSFGLLLGFLYYLLVTQAFDFLNYGLYEDRLNRSLFYIAALFIPTIITQKYLRSIIRGLYHIKLYSILLDLIVPVLRLLLILIVIYNNSKIGSVIYIPLLTQLIVTVYMFGYLFLIGDDRKKSQEKMFLEYINIAKFALKTYLGTALQKGSVDIIMLIASTLLSFRDMGMLSIAQKLLQGLSGISNSVVTVLMPKVSRSKLSEIRVFIPRVVSILFSFNICLFFVFILLIERIVLLLYGKDFQEVYILSIPLAGSAILLSISNVLLSTLTFTGNPMIKTYSRGIGFLINLLLYYPLFTLFGTLGFVLSITLGQISIFISSFLFFMQKFKDIGFKELFIPTMQDIDLLYKNFKYKIRKS